MKLGAHGFICDRLSAPLSDMNVEGEGTNLRDDPPAISPLPDAGAPVSAASPASPAASTSTALGSRFCRRFLYNLRLILFCLAATPPRIADKRRFGSFFVHFPQLVHHCRRDELVERSGENFRPDVTSLQLGRSRRLLSNRRGGRRVRRGRDLRLGSGGHALLRWGIV
jgi:hypothetical protein